MTPEQRSLRARIAAHAMHARHDSTRTSAAGRRAFLASFERKVDPDGTLPPEERRRRAEHALKAHMQALAVASAKARAAKTRRGGGGRGA